MDILYIKNVCMMENNFQMAFFCGVVLHMTGKAPECLAVGTIRFCECLFQAMWG